MRNENRHGEAPTDFIGEKKNLLRYLKTKLPALFEVKKGHDVYLKKIVWVILI